MNSIRASPVVRQTSGAVSLADEAADFDLRYTRKDMPRLGWVKAFAKSSAIALLLFSALAVASIWASSGVKFFYDAPTSQSPLLKCPSLWNYDVFSQAPYCKITIDIVAIDVYQKLTLDGLTAPTETLAKQAGLCVVPAIDPADLEGPDAHEKVLDATDTPMMCYSKEACQEATTWRTLNPYSISSLTTHSNYPFCQFKVQSTVINTLCSSIMVAESYCDSSYSVSPSTVISIRGALIGVALLWLLLIVHDLYQIIVLSSHNKAILKFRKSFFSKYISEERFELYAMCLSVWNSMTAGGNSTIQRSFTNVSAASSPVVRTPTGSNISSAFSLIQPSGSSMPHQPVLTPRKSLVSDYKNSPRGYTPRLDSAPAAVVSNISVAGKKLSRFNGSIDIMFKTVWKKRIARHFKNHSRNIRSVKLRRFVWRSIAIALIAICVFILLLRLVFLMETNPFVTRIPEGVSLYQYMQLPSTDKLYSIFGAVWADLRRNNPTSRFYLVMWADFLIYLDVIYESAILLILSFMAIGTPTNVFKRDCVLESKPNDRPPSARNLKMGHTGSDEENFLDDTRVPPSPISEDTGNNSPVSNFSSPVHMIQPKIVTSSLVPIAIPKLVGSPFRDSEESSAVVVPNSAFGLPMDPLPSQSIMCVMMSVSAPCATKASRRDFVFKLQAIRQLVESDIDIFVVDCGSTREPIDDTEYVIKSEISEKINYVYFPESNRVLSLYWTSKYWIPFLFSSNLCGDYIYTMLVDEQVAFNNANFKLPSAEFLMNNPRIKTLYVPVKESPRIFSSDFMDRWRERIQLCAVNFACGGSTTHSGDVGVPQIWERNTFEMTCFNLNDKVESRMVSLMEMKQNGRRLLRNRGSSKLSVWISEGGHSQPSFTGAKKFIGFRKPGISVFTNMHEFIDPSSFLHWPSVLSKLIILGEIANTFFDSIRIFLLPGLLIKDPIGFGIATAIVGIICVLPYLVNLLVNIRYEDQRAAKALYVLLVFPFQLILKEIPRRTVCFFKEYVRDTLFTKYESDLTIGEREEQFRDLPIVPPHPNPHWSTVWM